MAASVGVKARYICCSSILYFSKSRSCLRKPDIKLACSRKWCTSRVFTLRNFRIDSEVSIDSFGAFIETSFLRGGGLWRHSLDLAALEEWGYSDVTRHFSHHITIFSYV